jgi:hypothetical protein
MPKSRNQIIINYWFSSRRYGDLKIGIKKAARQEALNALKASQNSLQHRRRRRRLCFLFSFSNRKYVGVQKVVQKKCSKYLKKILGLFVSLRERSLPASGGQSLALNCLESFYCFTGQNTASPVSDQI